jgi:hypothetical protein
MPKTSALEVDPLRGAGTFGVRKWAGSTRHGTSKWARSVFTLGALRQLELATVKTFNTDVVGF